jgi:hypothetical protein
MVKMMIAAAALVAATAGADAQTFQPEPEPRWFISANGLFQPGSSGFSEEIEFQEFVETGTIETSFEPADGIGFDGSIGVRVWQRVGIGVAVSTYAPDAGGTVTARIPHPLHFNQHREVTGEADLTRKETAVHANLLYFVPAGDRLQVIVGAGASYFQAEQSFVNDVTYSHEYPFDTAEFLGVDRDNETGSALGFNATLDVGWKFSRSFGLGALVRYAQASVPFTPGEREVTVDVGGFHGGLGIRVNF